jgi:hypothetical protein
MVTGGVCKLYACIASLYEGVRPVNMHIAWRYDMYEE